MPTKRLASPELEAFVDEAIRLSKERGYNPSIFVGMRHQFGTIDAIERLVQSGDLQSGFKRLKQLGLIDWTNELAAMSEFGDRVLAIMRNNARNGASRRCGRKTRTKGAWAPTLRALRMFLASYCAKA